MLNQRLLTGRSMPDAVSHLRVESAYRGHTVSDTTDGHVAYILRYYVSRFLFARKHPAMAR